MGELKNKVILITGASRGIGLGIAKVCAREGAKVVVSSPNLENCKKVVKMLPGGEMVHCSLSLDVTLEQDLENGIAIILERYGKIDGLVNNAGIDFGKPLMETSTTDWNKVMDINLNSVFSLCQLIIPHFLKQGSGSIVNISSVHTHATYAGSGPYAATKGALNMLTKSFACEFGKHNIKVNCVAPGLVKTSIWEDLVKDFDGTEEECLDYWKKNIPSRKIIEPEEIGELVSFLLSERASCMNGSVIYADGGLTSQLIASTD